MDRALPFAQTTGELELIRGEDVANQVAQQPSAIFLGGVDSFVPLLISDEERIVLQELFTALQGGVGHTWHDHYILKLRAFAKVLTSIRAYFNLYNRCWVLNMTMLKNFKHTPQRLFVALLPVKAEFSQHLTRWSCWNIATIMHALNICERYTGGRLLTSVSCSSGIGWTNWLWNSRTVLK